MNILHLYKRILRYLTRNNKTKMVLIRQNQEFQSSVDKLSYEKQAIRGYLDNATLKNAELLSEMRELKNELNHLRQKENVKSILRDFVQEIRKLFNNEYFRGLTNEEIAELAKKSIRVTAYNRELEHKLKNIKELLHETQSKSEQMNFSDFKQYFDEEFIEKIYAIINESER